MNGRILHRALGHSVGALLLVVASSLKGVAEQRPTFKSDVDVVAINVVVTNTEGRAVTNLNEDSFQVSEDGRPQRIIQFTKDPLPRRSRAGPQRLA